MHPVRARHISGLTLEERPRCIPRVRSSIRTRYDLFQDLSDWHPVDVIATSVQETAEHGHTHITRHSADGAEELGLVAR